MYGESYSIFNNDCKLLFCSIWEACFDPSNIMETNDVYFETTVYEEYLNCGNVWDWCLQNKCTPKLFENIISQTFENIFKRIS